MSRVCRITLLPTLLLALAACGAAGSPTNAAATPGPTTVVGRAAEGDTPPESGTDNEPVLTPTAMVEQNTGPVTAIMQTLELTGEQYAAEGDPDAPITVVEFSDYG